ncbi:MAG TPA: DUF2959 family protein [Planctomycetota bacterium]|nr:DUF2959 family protein [Planctomycetota bacterium]
MKSNGTGRILALVLLAGCGGPETGQERAERAAQSIEQFRTELNDGMKQVDAGLAALNGLSAATDKKAAYDKLTSEIANTESKAAEIRESADAMKAGGRNFFKKWEEQLAEIKDETLRARAKERASERSKQYADLELKMGTAKGAYPPYLQDLKDAHTALANDLNAKGIAAADSLFKKANLDGVELKNRINDVAKVLDGVEADLRPAK